VGRGLSGVAVPSPRTPPPLSALRASGFLFLYVEAFARYEKVLENFSRGPGKVLDFFVRKKVGTLSIYVMTIND